MTTSANTAPATAPEFTVEQCFDRISIAQSRMSMTNERYQKSVSDLEGLESSTDPHHRIGSVFVLAYSQAKTAVIEAAQDLQEANGAVEQAQRDLASALASRRVQHARDRPV